jgi:hypothetical protein
MSQEDKIPLFRRWRSWYIFVLLFLLIDIIAFLFFTQYFS